MADPSGFREAPAEFLRKRDAWVGLENKFAWLHIFVGGASVVLGTVIAANIKSKFLAENWAFGLAAAAAFFSFANAFIKADLRSASYRAARHVLEKAIIGYQVNPEVTLKDIGDAQVRSIEILDSLTASK